MARIAVVNDDTVFLGMMAAVLDELGWETMICRERDNALASLTENPPDLIILDIRMEAPDTGWTLLELFTLDRRLSTIPVIVCSAALLDLRAHQDWLNENGIAVLPKPFNIDQLQKMVEEALRT